MNESTPDGVNGESNCAGTSRREAIGAISLLGVAAIAGPACAQMSGGKREGAGANRGALTAAELGFDSEKGEYVVPALPYAYDALEPDIDAQTMKIHHDKHHAGYVRGLNRALGKLAQIRASGDASLIKHWSRELAFHGSGHVNHTLFWMTMAPIESGGGGRPSGALAQAIDRDFGSFDSFSAQFQAAAKAVEGSGWGWLAHEPVADKLLVMQGEKQQNMLMTGVTPILGVDVWEHAYYLRYQNRRGDYLKAFMNVINWPMVKRLYDRA